VLIAAGIYTEIYLFNSAEQINADIVLLNNNIINNNWKNAKKNYDKLTINWDKTENTWDLIVDHQERDKITISLAALEQYINTENKSLSLGELNILKKLIEHIPEKEKFCLKNIF
jgi:hypothetical protein